AEIAGRREIRDVARGLVERQGGAREQRMVVRERRDGRRAAPPRAEETAVRVAEVVADEGGGFPGRTDVARLIEDPARFGERADRERVPSGEDLVVRRRRHAVGSSAEERLPSTVGVWIDGRGAEDVRAFPVAFRASTD